MAKRVRVYLATVLTLVLVMQSVASPALMIAGDMTDNESAVQSEEIAPGEQDGDDYTDTDDDTSQDGKEGNSDDNAGHLGDIEDADGEPEPGDGIDQTDEGDGSVVSSNGMFMPMALITNNITNLEVVTSGGSTDFLNNWETIDVSGNFVIPAGSNAGDTFELGMPSQLQIPVGLEVDLVGYPPVTMRFESGKVVFTLNESVTVDHNDGWFEFGSTVQTSAISWDDEVTFVFDIGTTVSFTFETGSAPGGGPGSDPRTEPLKYGWANTDGTLTFQIHTGQLPGGGSFTITDNAVGYTFDCSATILVWGDAFDEWGYLDNAGNSSRSLTGSECSPTDISVSETLLPGEGAYIQVKSHVVPGGFEFTNNATVTRTDTETHYVSTSVVSYYAGGGITGPATPVTVEVGAQVCVGGSPTVPSITSPAIDGGSALIDGVLYTDGSVVPNGDVLEVRLTAQRGEGQSWSITPGSGWTIDPDNDRIAYYFDDSIEIQPCDAEEAGLVLPTVDAAVCEGGVEPSPSIVGVVNSDDVTYTIVQEIDGDGNFIVTATLVNTDLVWPETLPSNAYGSWALVDEVMTFTGQVDIVPCEQVELVIPAIIGNVCEGGVYTPPTVSFGAPNDDIEYINGVASGGQVTAEAQLTREGTGWGDLTGTGWTVNPEDATRATYNGTYVEAPCAPVVPAMPIVQEAVCVGGELIDPVITTNDTERITYTRSGDEVSGSTVVITATLADGYEWDDNMPAGWTVNTENPAEATYTVQLADVECTPVVPVLPNITGNVCVDGLYIPPTATANGPDGVAYSDIVAADGTITATATLANGYAWDIENLPVGWVVDAEDLARATYVGTYEEAPCTPVVPEIPEVTPAVCEGDDVVPPSVEVPTTPGVTYTKEGEEESGGTVVVTATLEPGYEWGVLPEGWTLVDSMTATYTVTFSSVSCEAGETPPAKVTDLPNTGVGTWNTTLNVAFATMAAAMLAAVVLRVKVSDRS